LAFDVLLKVSNSINLLDDFAFGGCWHWKQVAMTFSPLSKSLDRTIGYLSSNLPS